MNAKANEIKVGLQHFSGTDVLYKISLLGTFYTNGINYLAQAAECFWLINDVSLIAKCLTDKSYFITIDFKRFPEDEQDFSGYEAEISYSDGNGTVFQTHRYNVTDFPMDELRLFFVDGTLMLPSEY